MRHTPERIGEAPGSRCEECDHIKAAYYVASRHGDREAAAFWATEMGLHQRAAHS
ncbi:MULTISPECIES: hypothetical protein [Streptomyces]|uniref:Uncharacterized protein n=1 Tax=Streptomyces hesseae TaxID=3075519 RepID=A0ABU2SR61_9ACTN|nr:hypothetical protein [Streptomyces sp. DSM 40473]MDT0451233.1 hypothetical protein [Streptomyces sp. DSM 40473]